MKTNHLRQLGTLGQSLWLDFIRRDLLTSGDLCRMIEEDGLRGMTSNPAIFEKSISESQDYDRDIRTLAAEGKDARTTYEALSRSDVQAAADDFRQVYDSSEGRDGYVSLEVNPHLARDTQGTIRESRRLWADLARPNVLIKVPGTVEGLGAIHQLTREGINVNVTLLFGLPRYRQVVEAYLSGLEERVACGDPVRRSASVASFFVSRIDAKVDPQLEECNGLGGSKTDVVKMVLGQVAVASAKLAYQAYRELFGGERFKPLAAQGATPQRLLWASTGTKDPAASDVKYIEELIGPETINTVPVKTLEAYRDHGNPRVRLDQGLPEAQKALGRLTELGISLDFVTQQLEDEGVEGFLKSFDRLLEILAQRAQQPPAAKP